MIKKIFLISAVLILVYPGCLRQTPAGTGDPFALFEATAGRNASCEEIARINQGLKERSAYIYAFDVEGKIVCHPQPSIVGMDFSRYPFVGQILDDEDGCLSYESGEVTLVLIFSLRKGLIYCLSVNTHLWPADYSRCLPARGE